MGIIEKHRKLNLLFKCTNELEGFMRTSSSLNFVSDNWNFVLIFGSEFFFLGQFPQL